MHRSDAAHAPAVAVAKDASVRYREPVTRRVRRPTAGAARRVPTSRIVRALLGLATFVAFAVAVRAVGGELPRFAAWVHGHGAWAPLAYVVGYVVLTVALVPGALPTMIAGVVFDLGPGTLYAFVGEVLGGALSFALARSIAHPLVEHRLARSVLFLTLDRAIARQGRRIVFMLRLSPAIPFNVLNYALGLTTIRFGDYLLASFGMLPGALLYVYYGKLIGDVAALAGGADVPHDAVYWTATVLGLAATMTVSVVLARIATRALREAQVTPTARAPGAPAAASSSDR